MPSHRQNDSNHDTLERAALSFASSFALAMILVLVTCVLDEYSRTTVAAVGFSTGLITSSTLHMLARRFARKEKRDTQRDKTS